MQDPVDDMRHVAIWKWISATLAAGLMLLLGALGGDVSASLRYARLHQRMTDHERLQGHPVMVQRVYDLEEDNRVALSEIKAKLERQSMVLREIERSVSSHASGQQ